MPREIVVLTPTPPDAAALLRAGAAVDDQLRVRTMLGGAVTQLCQGDGTGDSAVMSVAQPLQVDNVAELDRLLPDAPALRPPLWWTEILAPWGPRGTVGVAVAYELAAGLGGACVVQDGE